MCTVWTCMVPYGTEVRILCVGRLPCDQIDCRGTYQFRCSACWCCRHTVKLLEGSHFQDDLGSNFTRSEGTLNIPQSFLSLQIFASNIKMTSVELCICVPFGCACGRLLCASGVFCNFLNPGQSL